MCFCLARVIVIGTRDYLNGTGSFRRKSNVKHPIYYIQSNEIQENIDEI